MKTLLVAPLLIVAAAAAWAQQGSVADDPASPKSRAQVRSEYERARADGTFYRGTEETLFYDRLPSRKSRAQVRDEIARARAEGTLDRGSEITLFPEENVGTRTMGSGTPAAAGGKR